MFLSRVLCVVFMAVIGCCHVSGAEIGIGSECTVSTDCVGVENAVCIDESCACMKDYVADSDSRRCLHVVNHDEACTETLQCQYSQETECRNNKCQCKANYNYNGALCVGSLSLGENCVRDIECSLPDDLKQERVWCYSGQCSCKKGFIRDGDRCVIGGDCTSDQDCKDLENSLCNIMLRDRAKCACLDSFVVAGNNTRCLPRVHEIGTGCQYSEQCSPNLGKVECIENQCQCAEGATLNKEDGTCGAAFVHVISLSCLVVAWIAKLF